MTLLHSSFVLSNDSVVTMAHFVQTFSQNKFQNNMDLFVPLLFPVFITSKPFKLKFVLFRYREIVLTTV